MKISFLEPLGVEQSWLSDMISKRLGSDVEVVYWPDRATDTDTLVRRSEGADAVVLTNFKFGRDVISRCPDLKMICVAFTGYDHVDMACCMERGITVCNCAGYSTSAVADLVFALAIDLARNVVACDERTRSGGTKDGLVGFELEGKTFGVIGAGAIGQRVAKIAAAFGCRVLVSSRTKREVADAEFVDLKTLLRESDIVSLHVPQSAETKGMIGRDELASMKPTALLINTARGPVVDARALADALKEGKIAGAGIDVFDAEPPLGADEPLLNAPHTLLTPHIGFASHQAFMKRAAIVAEDLAKWIDGAPQNVVS